MGGNSFFREVAILYSQRQLGLGSEKQMWWILVSTSQQSQELVPAVLILRFVTFSPAVDPSGESLLILTWDNLVLFKLRSLETRHPKSLATLKTLVYLVFFLIHFPSLLSLSGPVFFIT